MGASQSSAHLQTSAVRLQTRFANRAQDAFPQDQANSCKFDEYPGELYLYFEHSSFFMQLLAFHGGLETPLRTAIHISADPPSLARPPTDLGLERLRGVVSYTYLAPSASDDSELPTIVLLGDEHSNTTCPLLCESAVSCVSVDGHPNSFLHYLDDTFKVYSPDVFMESWESQEVRREKAGPHNPLHVPAHLRTTMVVASDRPIDHFSYSLVPCAIQGHVGVERATESVDDLTKYGMYECPYRHLRAHFIDLRQASYGEKTAADASRDATLSTVIADMRRWSRPKLLEVWAYFYPGFTPLDIYTSVVAGYRSAAAFFENPFLLTHSRTSHELTQLPLRIFNTLKTQATVLNNVFAMLDPQSDEAIQLWLKGEGPDCLDASLSNMLFHFQQRSYFSHASMDLYGLARALKVDKSGARKQLCVFYVGDNHCDTIRLYLGTLYTVHRYVQSADKCISLTMSLHDMQERADKTIARNCKNALSGLQKMTRLSKLKRERASREVKVWEKRLQDLWTGPDTEASLEMETYTARAVTSAQFAIAEAERLQNDLIHDTEYFESVLAITESTAGSL
jgi:hypothetical protein